MVLLRQIKQLQLVFLLQKKWAEVNAQIKRRGLDAASAETPAPPVASTPTPMGDVPQDVLLGSFPVADSGVTDDEVGIGGGGAGYGGLANTAPGLILAEGSGDIPVTDAPSIAAPPSATGATTPAAPPTPNKGSEYDKASQELYAQITEWEKAGIPANTIGDALASILKATITELNRNPNDVVLNARVTAISEIYNQWFSQNK